METELLDELADLAADLREHLRAGVDGGVSHIQRERPGASSRQVQEVQSAAPTRRPPSSRRPRPQPAMPTRDRTAKVPPPPPHALPSRPVQSRWPTGARTAPDYAIGDAVGAWGLPENARRPSGDKADALLAVRRRLGDCKRCRLCEGRNKLVFGMGNPEADLVILGEGPGFNEDKEGLPFVGPSGEMLDKMLGAVLGLGRHEVYILNVVKCRPPNNRTPHPDEVDACAPVLQAQLQAIQPRIILAMGSPAAKTLLRTTRGVMSLRGRWQTVPIQGAADAAVMCTFHPAYLLRRPADKRKTFDDLKMVRTRYDEIKGLRLEGPA